MIFPRHVVWRLVLQCIRAFSKNHKALVLIESGPIQSAADVIKLEVEAKVILTFKKDSTCLPKFTYDYAFFSTILAFLETQEVFATHADRIRAADAVCKRQNVLVNGANFSRAAFFDCLHGIFRPDMGLTAEADVEAHLAVTAFHAKENYGNRGAPRKENVNPQFNKRKAATIEATRIRRVMQILNPILDKCVLTFLLS